MQEIWKDIKGYEGLYQVSNLGRIKSLPRKLKIYNQYGFTNKYSCTREKILKLQQDRHGYLRVCLSKYKNKKLLQVHRLVAQAFIPNTNDLPCVNHKNENKSDNHVDNLEWCTYKYNTNYGTCMKRVIDKQSLYINQYDMNGVFIKTWKNINETSKILKINHANIISCCKNRRKSAGGYIWKYMID